jgi:hypothetical protein
MHDLAVAIGEAMAFGAAVYDQRSTPGLSVAGSARRDGMTECLVYQDRPGVFRM